MRKIEKKREIDNLRNHSRKLRKEDGAINAMSFLSDVIRPVFHVSYSNMIIVSLSISPSFLESNFVLPRESLHILNDSIKGYMRFSPTWKNNEVALGFVPLEMAENYYPEEIEEELIIPHYASNKPAVVQSNVTSFSSNLAKGDVLPAVNDIPVPATAPTSSDSSIDVLSKATSKKPTIENELARHENTHLKKSFRNSTFEEDGSSGKREREPLMDRQNHSAQKKTTTKGFESENSAFSRINSRSNLTSPSKGVPDNTYYQVQGEATRQSRAIHDRSKRTNTVENLRNKNPTPHSNMQAPSPSHSKQHKSGGESVMNVDVKGAASRIKDVAQTGEPLNDNIIDNNNDYDNSTTTYRSNKIENHKPFKIQAKPKDSTRSSKSFHADNVVRNLGRRVAASEDRDSTPKVISRTIANEGHKFSSPDQSANNYRERRLISNKQGKSDDAFDNKPPLFTQANVNPLQRKRELVHNIKAHDDQYPKLISSDALIQRSEKVSSVVDSMNLHQRDDQMTSEDSLTRTTNLRDTSNLRAQKKPSIRDVFDTKSTFDNLNIISETDKFDSPSVTINKLDVTVVGNGKDSENSETTEDFLGETAESSDEISHYFSDHDPGSLNKSYLWRYKVKF